MSQVEVVRGLAAPFIANDNVRLSLAATMRAIGVPVLPQAKVDAHKRHLTRHFSPVRYALAYFFSWCSLFAAADAIDRLSYYRASSAIIVSYLALVTVAALAGLTGIANASPELVLGLIPIVSLLAFALTATGRSEDLRAIARWERASLYRYDRTPGANPITLRLRERALTVRMLTGAKVMVDYYDTDPFLLAVRGWGPWKEVVTIGAWDTGNPELDNR